MTSEMPVNFVWLIVSLSVILGLVRILHMVRGRAMRAFAAKWGFQYIGPTAPPQWWWNPSRLEIHRPLTRSALCGLQPRQIWNVIEGNINGMTVFIFDGILGSKGGQPFTVIACKTEQEPFQFSPSADRVIRSHGWTVLYGVWFLWFSWTMSTRRLDERVNELHARHPAVHEDAQ